MRVVPVQLVPVALALAATSLSACDNGSTSAAGRPQTTRAAPPGARTATGPAADPAPELRRLARIGLPVYCGGHKPYAAFTFDDGPGPYTPLALRSLRARHVPATFFLVGRNVVPFRASAQREARHHALGDHSFTHPLLSALPAGAVESEIARTRDVIARVTGRRVQLFRPPYEARNAVVDATAKRLGLVEILWSTDSRDSEGANWAGIARNVEHGLRPGSIVLMHENRGQTIRALKFRILPALRRRHIRLVTVPQLLALDPPSDAQLRRGRNGCRPRATAGGGG